MELVVNEWLPEYLRPTESLEKRKLAVEFLNTFISKRHDIIVVRKPSEFLFKIYRYAHEFENDTRNYKHLFKIVHLDSERTRLIENTDIKVIPLELEEKLRPPFDSDRYLFESALCSKDRIIITTDKRLCEQMKDISLVKVVLLEDFLKTYNLI